MQRDRSAPNLRFKLPEAFVHLRHNAPGDQGINLTRIVCIIALACASCAASAQSFDIRPANPVLAGEPLSIRLVNLPAGEKVQVVAERAIPGNAAGQSTLYRSEASFVSQGSELDLASAKPESGTYTRADVRGLFWSMRPVKDAPTLPPKQVKLTARAGERLLASAVVEFIEALPQVTVEEVPEFPGAVFATLPGPQKRPTIIVLGGSEGGSSSGRKWAPRLASRGFAVLGFPYYSPPGPSGERELPALPAGFTDIPVDRLDRAFEWLKARKDVDASRVALYGASKGAEFALIAASHFKWISAAVAEVPTDVVWEGFGPDVPPGTRSSFSFQGKPLPFVPYEGMEEESAGFSTGAGVRFRRPADRGRAAHPAAAVKARIRVEDFRGPLLVTAGQDDQVWASGMMAQNIAERREAAGLETVVFIFSDAGHAIGSPGWAPTTQYDADLFKVGGTPEGNAAAQAIVFPQTIAFLKRTLGQ
jgi:dienelactone hydrolase